MGYTASNGASYAGQGGSCQGVAWDNTYGEYDMNFNDSKTKEFQFGSGGGHVLTRGGGRIALITADFQVATSASIDANGGPIQPIEALIGGDIQGGSGGYVYIEFRGNSTAFQLGAQVNAFGGPGQNQNTKTNGGSGGRVVFNFPSITIIPSTQQISIGGGSPPGTLSPGQECLIGGSGTFYIMNKDHLIVKGIGQKILSKTPIEGTDLNDKPNFKNLTTLVVIEQGIATAKIMNVGKDFNRTTMYVQNIHLFTKSILTTPIIDNEIIFSFEISALSFIANETSLVDTSLASNSTFNVSNFYMDDTASIEGGQFLFIFSKVASFANSITLTNKQLTQTKTGGLYRDSKSTYALIYTEDHFSLAPSSTFESNYATIISSKHLNISGRFVNINSYDKNVISTCADDELGVISFVTNAQQLPLTFDQLNKNILMQLPQLGNTSLTIKEMLQIFTQNFTHTFISFGNLTVNQGSVHSPRIAMYANEAIIKGSLNTNGLGCQGDDGNGRGHPGTSLCGGSGGAYGGQGGGAFNLPQVKLAQETQRELSAQIPEKSSSYPHSICCYCNIAQPYGSYSSNIVSEGSGGGSAQIKTAGAGGGIIWLQANSLILEGQLQSEGTNATQKASGGGSGGSVFISVNRLAGNGQISAKGGSSLIASGGGGGSGGRIKILYFSWYNSSSYPQMTENSYIDYDFSGGIGSTISQANNGTVWSTPCISGYYGIFCKKCQVGFYKTDMSNAQCQKCQSMPPGANATYTEEGWSDPLCPYQCDSSLTPFEDNPNCENDFKLFVSNLGGIQIFVIIIIATVFGIFVVLYFLQYGNAKTKFDEDEGDNLKKAFEELDLLERDLPSHIGRVYMLGLNYAMSPWHLPLQPPLVFKNKIDVDKYNKFIESINEGDKWTKVEIAIHISSLVLYPAITPFISKILRKKHYMNYKKTIIDHVEDNSYLKSVEDRVRKQIQFRFTVGEDYALAYLDFLDLNKEKDSYAGPDLPLTLLFSGSGTFSNPYYLNINDPLVKSVSYFVSDLRIWRKFVANLNSKLLTLQINNFIFYNKRKMLAILEYINKYSVGIFEPYGFKINLWLLQVKYEKAGEKEGKIIYEPEDDYFPLHLDYLSRRQSVLSNFLDYWRRSVQFGKKMEFKLALILARKEDMRIEPFDKTHRQEQAKASGANSGGSKSPITPNNPKATLRKKSAAVVTPMNTSPNTPNMKRTPNDHSYDPQRDRYISLLTSHTRESNINQGRVRIFKDLGKPFIQYLQDIPSFFISVIQFTTLRHQGVIMYFPITVIFFILFIVIDIMFTMQMLLHIFLPTNGLYILGDYGWTFIFFYPFASIISPLLGCLAFIMCKPFVYKAFSYMNSLSLFANVLSMIIAEIFVGVGFQFYMYNLLILFITKIIIAQLLSLQIAYFKNPKYYHYKNQLDEQVKSIQQMHQDQNFDQVNAQPPLAFEEEDYDDDSDE